MGRRAGEKQPEVLLVNGMGDWSGVLRLPWILQRAGARVVALTPTTSKLARSWHLDEVVGAPAEADGFVDALFEYLRANPGRFGWVLMGNEPTVLAVARDKRVREVEWFCVDPKQNLELMTNKGAMLRACVRSGAAVPMTVECKSLKAVQAATKHVGYPLILKPCVGWAGTGVRKVETPDELEGIWQEVAHHAPLIAQQFIDGQIGMTQVLFVHGKPMAWASSFKTTVWPEPFGPSAVRTMMDDPQIEPLIRDVGRATGFHGLCGIEWMQRESDGYIQMIEFNPRPTPAMDMGRVVRMDAARGIKAMLVGKWELQRPQPVRGSRAMVYHFPQQVTRALMCGEFGDLWRWLPGMASHDMNWAEPRVLWADVKVVARQAMGLVMAKIRRGRDEARASISALVRGRVSKRPVYSGMGSTLRAKAERVALR